MTLAHAARRPGDPGAQADGARVAILVTSDRPSDQLHTRVARVRGVGDVTLADVPPVDADLVIVRLGPTECTAALDRIRALGGRTPVLAIGPVALSSRALRLGATGYLAPKDLDLELEAAIGAVMARRRHVGTAVVDGYLHDGLAAASSVNRLSSRELEVVCRAGRGESPARTASAIGVAAEAVTQYRLRARAKLGLGTTGQLRAFAAAHGLR